MKRRTFCTILLAAPALTLHAGSATARGVRKRLKFARNASSTSVDGAVIRGESDVYIIGARKGQHMTVKVTSVEDNAVFQLMRSDDDSYLDGAGEIDDATTWEGDLPGTGDYEIVVGPSRGNATYSLFVSIH